jgi:rhamnose transport system permease protein
MKNRIIDKPQGQNIFTFFTKARESVIISFTLVLILIVSIRTDTFLNVANFQDILLDIAIVSIVAMGEMMVMITGGIDISIGSGLALSAMIVGVTLKSNPGITNIVAVLMGIGIGTILGAFNGFVVTKMKVPPIITTLGTYSLFRGLVILVSGGTWIAAYQIPEGFKNFSLQPVAGIPFLVILAIINTVLFYIFMKYTTVGRQIYAVGGNEVAAKLAGIRVNWIKFLTYTLSGTLFGAAGVFWLSRYAIAANNTASDMHLQAITACVIGGVSIMGGAGSVIGVILGAFLFGIINNAINLIGISEFWKEAFYGLAILVAVITDMTITRRLQKMKLKKQGDQ